MLLLKKCSVPVHRSAWQYCRVLCPVDDKILLPGSFACQRLSTTLFRCRELGSIPCAHLLRQVGCAHVKMVMQWDTHVSDNCILFFMPSCNLSDVECWSDSQYVVLFRACCRKQRQLVLLAGTVACKPVPPSLTFVCTFKQPLYKNQSCATSSVLSAACMG